MIAYICLGSNLQDPALQLYRAVESLKSCEDISVSRCSSVITTAAYGFTEQPDFMNQVVEISTLLEPHALLDRLKSIESTLGREPT
ncbi:MAG: 2-amino-4-hydroxy-6-hydroxymethyldihydropteridine diphosphokinase, partial [Candidatus Cloacimonadaceae bacterium]|nr:2-amino-4-hydroxy-6-hydroxymethyldihydropteridine diphosphokinase [Candidatus Cloacimonadaceae bacterium]